MISDIKAYDHQIGKSRLLIAQEGFVDSVRLFSSLQSRT